MNRNHTLFFFLALSASQYLSAQTAPTPPLVKFPTGNAAWIVDIVDDHAASDTGSLPALSNKPQEAVKPNPNAHAVKVEVVRTGDIARYLTSWSDGTTSEDWLTPRCMFIQDHISGGIRICSKTETSGEPNSHYDRVDESEFAWIQQSAYLGQKNFNGKDCSYYKRASDQAWIENKTHLPVAYDNAQRGLLYLYSFKPAPNDVLVLPLKCQTILAEFETYMTPAKGLGSPPPPPPP